MTSALHRAQWSDSFPAPAKINLFLHVVGRRADGYHLLETLFRLIDISDTLRFVARPDTEVRLVTDSPGLNTDNDLCVRAARALKAESGHAGGVDIHLEKRIPMGGGLGGGSSDAATTLLALNSLWGLGFSSARLAALAIRLGADVPFFLLGCNAFAGGIGEELTEVNLAPAWYVVLIPPVAVPTPTVFASPELTRDTKSIKILGFSGASNPSLAALSTGSVTDGSWVWPAWEPGFGHNDLEPVVCRRYPEVARHLDCLQRLAPAMPVRMSGSGACVFAEVGSEAEARRILAATPAGMRGLIAKGLDAHPLRHVQDEQQK
jgi:4-diphosphocytidyl-2-C-methyl-D-erythritol kinase